ncbi:hypothetical protein [Spiroplasma tabanidicola]|uniref:Uncharacterized protein n=1 Tax=Spiroplasma tabanidicola TaxID=324079 RepID=A0A6I6C4V9_9MOLU|nr:hypothetical protein [Spiroplasma tabanidicola]QGS51857.1 hypothetical protein STABA_v1c04940 [Spiroplasma tabanidicola]
MNLHSQAQKIIDLFDNDNGFVFWKMGTRIYTILYNFFEYYSSIPKNKKFMELEVKDSNGKYFLMCGDQNITPSTTRNYPISKSSIRQYIDVLCSFDLIVKSNYNQNIYLIKKIEALSFENIFNPNNIFFELVKENIFLKYEQAKKIFYSCIISKLASLFEEDETLYIKFNNKKKEKVKCIDIIKQCKKCGYQDFFSVIDDFGKDLEDLYNFINDKIICRI